LEGVVLSRRGGGGSTASEEGGRKKNRIGAGVLGFEREDVQAADTEQKSAEKPPR